MCQQDVCIFARLQGYRTITTDLHRRDNFSDFLFGVSAVIFRFKMGNLREGWAWKDRRVPR